jgi:hypothetical protein
MPENLLSALDHLEAMMLPAGKTPPLYLHCWGGIERSPLLAIGLLCRLEKLTLLDALAQVRVSPRSATSP